MSRFYLTVLVPDETPRDEIGLAVEDLMAPFDDPEKYQSELVGDQCRCGLVRAVRIGSWVAKKVYPKALLEKYPRATLEYLLLEQDTISEQLRYHLAHPKCQFCHGSGAYSPDFEHPVRYDWVTYGGEYMTGWIRGEGRAVKRDDPPRTLEDNLTTVREMLARYAPTEAENRMSFSNSLLTPDADWYTAPFGGLCMSRAEHEAFESEFLRRLRANLDCWAIGLECLV